MILKYTLKTYLKVKDLTLNKDKMKPYYLIILIFCSCKEKSENKINESHTIITTLEVHEETSSIVIPKRSQEKIGLINDTDGYTNARKEPSSSSEILFKILEDEYFMYTSIKESNWSEIQTLDNKVAYVHNSRIKKVNPNNVITFFSEYYDEDEEKDKLIKNIITIKSLDESKAFSIKEFPYSKLKIVSISNDTLILLSDDKKISIEVIAGLFEKEKHSIEYNENNYVNKIDSKNIYGNDQVPVREIKQIIIQKDDIKFELDTKVFSNLYEPNFEHLNVYIKGNNQLIMSMTNGHGAINSYKSILIFDNSNLLKHITYIPF